jgi:hypothetical protein
LIRNSSIRLIIILETVIALPKPRREFLKKALNTVGQNFGTAFLGKRKRRNLFIERNIYKPWWNDGN